MDQFSNLGTQELLALFGFVGALAGALATMLGQVAAAFVTAHLATQRQRRFDRPREKVLRHLLAHQPPGKKWRSMKTLSRAIGASEEETARLLVSVGARGSLRDAPVWGLIRIVGMPKTDDPVQDEEHHDP